MFPVFYWYFVSGMLNWLYVGVGLNGVCSWHAANYVKRVGEGFLRDIMSLAAMVGVGVLWSCKGMIFMMWSCDGVIFHADLDSVCCMLCCYWLGGSGRAESICVLNVMCLGCCLLSVVRAQSGYSCFIGHIELEIPRWSDDV